jgi:DNA-binding NarL/FixJ family response regulator
MAALSDSTLHTRLYHVEDSAELRRRVHSELAQIESVELTGYSGRAQEALREIRRTRPDVVVLDLQLPEGSGLDVLKGLRHDEWRPIVMVLTNHSDPTARERSLKAGAKYFFDKSTEFDLFLNALRQLSDRPLRAGRGNRTGAE